MPDDAPSDTPTNETDAAKKSVDAGIADETAAYNIATEDGTESDAKDSVPGSDPDVNSAPAGDAETRSPDRDSETGTQSS